MQIRNQQTFFVKGQTVNVLESAGHSESVAATQPATLLTIPKQMGVGECQLYLWIPKFEFDRFLHATKHDFF